MYLLNGFGIQHGVDMDLLLDASEFISGALGMTEISGSIVVEYDGTTIRDAFLGDTDQAFLATFTGATALSTGFEQFQVALPCIRLEGELPKSNAGDLIQVTHNFTGFDNTTAAQSLYISQRTADTAI